MGATRRRWGARIRAVLGGNSESLTPRDPKDPADMAPAAPKRVYGRVDEMGQLAACRSGVTAVVGDPGTGKTEILRSTTPEGALLGIPQPLARRSGALQTALLESLGKALIDHAAKHSTDAFARRLGAIVRALGEDQLSTAGKAVSRFLWGVAQDRLGSNATAVLKEFTAAVGATEGQQLADRVLQTAAGDVIRSFLDFAVAAIDLVEKPIVLRLDAAEKLHHDDFTQLLDVVEGCPDGLAVWIGHATSDHQSANRVRELEISGATVIPIGGLEYPVLMEWLKDEGIGAARAGQVAVTTLGYPLFVVAAIEHLQRGRVLGELRGEAGFVAQVQQNFHDLPVDLQRTCLHLAAHAVPLDRDQVVEAIGVDPESWSLHEAKLIERRLLSATVGDRPWFHELLRRALWDETFTDAQRALSADRAIPFLLGEVDKSGRYRFEHARNLVGLFAASEAQTAKYPEVRVCLELDRAPLRLLAALLELQEPPANAVDADMLFEYARSAFELDGDLTASLDQLEALELVVIAENAKSAAVAGFWKSTALRLVLLGRAMIEFDRTLLPATASTIFELVFRPKLNAFVEAQHGIGRPTLTSLAESAQKFDTSKVDGVISLHRRFGVLARTRWGHVPLYSAIVFEGIAERDEAIESLAELDSLIVFGGRLEIETLAPWPHPEPLPQGLLEAAAASISSDATDTANEAAASGAEVAANLERRVEIMTGIRSALTQFERKVLELDPVPGYVWASDERGTVVVHVRGFGKVREVPALLEEDLEKFWVSTVARVCDLDPGQKPVRLVTQSRAPSAGAALNDIVGDLTSTLAAFNRACRRPKLIIGSQSEDLENAIRAGLERRRAMADAMNAAIGLPSDEDEPLVSYELVIYLEPEDPAFFRGANGLMVTKVERTGPPTLSVRMVDNPDEAFGLYRRWIDDSVSQRLRLGQADLLAGLNELLGFGRGDTFVEIR